MIATLARSDRCTVYRRCFTSVARGKEALRIFKCIVFDLESSRLTSSRKAKGSSFASLFAETRRDRSLTLTNRLQRDNESNKISCMIYSVKIIL